MAESGLPPPLPPQIGAMALMISPALTPLATASLPHTARSVTLPSLTEASTPTILGSLSRRKSPSLRRAFASMPSRWAVTSLRLLTSLADVRKERASPSDACSLNFSSWLLISFISLSMPPMRLSSSFDVVFKSCAARRSFSWPLLSSSSVCLPVIASMRRTPAATPLSETMRKLPAWLGLTPLSAP